MMVGKRIMLSRNDRQSFAGFSKLAYLRVSFKRQENHISIGGYVLVEAGFRFADGVGQEELESR